MYFCDDEGYSGLEAPHRLACPSGRVLDGVARCERNDVGQGWRDDWRRQRNTKIDQHQWKRAVAVTRHSIHQQAASRLFSHLHHPTLPSNLLSLPAPTHCGGRPFVCYQISSFASPACYASHLRRGTQCLCSTRRRFDDGPIVCPRCPSGELALAAISILRTRNTAHWTTSWPRASSIVAHSTLSVRTVGHFVYI